LSTKLAINSPPNCHSSKYLINQGTPQKKKKRKKGGKKKQKKEKGTGKLLADK
jgi:hypothetical protein